VAEFHVTFFDRQCSGTSLSREVQDNGSRSKITAMIRSWKLEPARLSLDRLALKARVLSRSLGKRDLEVVVESPDDLRLDPLHWRSFWSALIQVIRNAVDHGIESPEEREAAGKRTNGRLTLATSRAGGRLVVEIADDGRGINWARVAAKARQAGLPCETAEDLTNAVFADGVTTRDSVSEVSGRGVGLAAVRFACLALGGQIQLDSTLGEKTRFRFVFPAPTLESAPSA
jgi:two-component system, chemotaxis family, sensor kinase CheA